jgi:23S rRNA (adenine-N6)-dimethyltransferase
VAGRRARGARLPPARSQHFLRTSTLAAALVRDACVDASDVVVDLGAGGGRLTAELARVARRVIAVELDGELAARLRGRWDNVVVVHGDAVIVPLPDEPFRVVANIPFSRTNDLLHRLLDDPRAVQLVRADLIVEWGVARKRALPWPSTVNGVIWGAFYEVTASRHLPRRAFAPPPGVDAGVLVFRRRRVPLVAPELAGSYRRFVAEGFRHGLRSVATPRLLGRIAERPAAARDLDGHQWAELFVRQFPTTGAGRQARLRPGQAPGSGRSRPAPRA